MPKQLCMDFLHVSVWKNLCGFLQDMVETQMHMCSHMQLILLGGATQVPCVVLGQIDCNKLVSFPPLYQYILQHCMYSAISVWHWSLDHFLGLVNWSCVCILFQFATYNLLQPLPACYWWLYSIADHSHKAKADAYFPQAHIHAVGVHIYSAEKRTGTIRIVTVMMCWCMKQAPSKVQKWAVS